MHSLPFRCRHWAGWRMTVRPGCAAVRGRMAAPLVAIVFLTGAIQLHAQSRTATTSLELQVLPEELLQVQNGSVALKIRLARGTTARLWEATSCASPSPDSQVIIASGTYTIPLNTLTPVSSNPISSTMQICLASSDGVLNDTRVVEISATGNGSAAPGQTPQLVPNGVSVDVPDGWVTTTQAGTTTWSNP